MDYLASGFAAIGGRGRVGARGCAAGGIGFSPHAPVSWMAATSQPELIVFAFAADSADTKMHTSLSFRAWRKYQEHVWWSADIPLFQF